MKFLVKQIKYYPIIINLYILILMVFYVLGFHVDLNRFLYVALGHGLYANFIIFGISKIFKFCIWHRLLLINMSSCLILEGLRQYGFNINNLPYIVVISTILTIFVSIIIFRRHGTFNKKESNTSTKGIN